MLQHTRRRLRRSHRSCFMACLTLCTLCISLTITAGCQTPTAQSNMAPTSTANQAAPSETEQAEQDAWPALKASYLAASRREHDHRISDWTNVERWNFDDNQMPAQFVPINGKWDVHEGVLRAYDGPAGGNRTIKIASCQWPAFRLTFDATLSPRPGYAKDRICDLGIRLNADPETGSFAKGYVAILAHYANQDAVIYRLNTTFVRTEFAPIQPNKRHRIMIEVVKPHIRVWVDDKIVIEAWERTGTRSGDTSDFLDMDPSKNIVLHTYDTDLAIDNLTISVPQKAK